MHTTPSSEFAPSLKIKGGIQRTSVEVPSINHVSLGLMETDHVDLLHPYPKVVAVIPCFNTEHTIRAIVLEVSKYVGQVTVIDDGSVDNTAEVAKEAGATVFVHRINAGKGAAMKTGVNYTNADIIVFIDGDGQHDPCNIPAILLPILEGKADIVIGSRFLAESKTYKQPIQRKLANIVASMIISFICYFVQSKHKKFVAVDRKAKYRLANYRWNWITDCTSGYRAITRKSWQQCEFISDRYQIETEMIYEAAKKGFVIAEVPITCSWKSNLSKLSVLKDGLVTIRLLMYKLTIYSKPKSNYNKL